MNDGTLKDIQFLEQASVVFRDFEALHDKLGLKKNNRFQIMYKEINDILDEYAAGTLTDKQLSSIAITLSKNIKALTDIYERVS